MSFHHRFLSTSVLGALLLWGCPRPAGAETNNPNTDWFSRAGYGVFVHYLAGLQNSAGELHSLGRETSWDKCVREFDTRRFADAMAEAGAGYVIFTMQQRTRFLIAPNATFDRISGYRPGEACATRDLVADLYRALHRKNIPLMLYWTGDGPLDDPKAGPAFGWTGKVSTDYSRKWASVVQEYGERYGDKVAGWWVDGSYRWLDYDDEKLGILARALKAGNPKRIIAFNPGVEAHVKAYSRHEDFTTGEQNRFLDQPAGRWIDGEQWHILSFLGASFQGWGQPGSKYRKADLIEYVHEVNRVGGVVSIDALLYRDGSLDRSQLEILKALRPGLAKMKSQRPVPPGNLAFRKPAQLLSLDGSHELEVNGGKHFAKLGVDGRLDTAALAGGEWPWTYEVDLLKVCAVRRLKVTFAKDGYATQFRMQVSPDRKAWQTVAAVENHDGRPHAVKCDPTAARYVRVSALKPDGPNQKGTQMAVAELEVDE
jgi:hypothetical protein